jgi:FkbM family methyltransferase
MHRVDMSFRHRIAEALPDGMERTLRHWLIPDESNLAYRIVRHRPEARVMLDVGAYVGSALGNFARDGWAVYAFEPDPVNRTALVERWGRSRAVHIDERAVSNEESSNVAFYRSDVSAGISGLSSFHASHRSAGTVDTITLEAFCHEQAIDAIDFLKVDTEGFDLPVLQGTPWNEVRPRVIVCEFENAKTIPLGYSFEDLADFLVDHGYQVLVSEWHPVVTYGGRHRWRGFARYPTALVDSSSWGNLIATRDGRDFDRLLARSRALEATWRFGAPLRRLLGGHS